MKNARYFIWTVAALLFASCDLSDPGGDVEINVGGSAEGSNAEANAIIAEMAEKYDITIQYNFDKAVYEWNWTEMLSSVPYTPAEPNVVADVLKFFEDEIFSVFPDGFLKNNLQPNLLLVDEMKTSFSWGNDDLGEGTGYNYLSGNTTRNVLVIGMANKDFAPSNDLKEAWISLIIERMMMNTNKWPRPAEFIKVTNPNNSTGTSGDTHWTNGSISAPNQWSAFGGGAKPDGGIWVDGVNVIEVTPADAAHVWWKIGLLKPGRLGFIGSQYFTWGMTFICMAKPSIGQDMGDYFVFITTKTAAEKEAFYQRIITGPGNHGGANSVNLIKQKVELCKKYFKDNFGIVLTEPS